VARAPTEINKLVAMLRKKKAFPAVIATEGPAANGQGDLGEQTRYDSNVTRR